MRYSRQRELIMDEISKLDHPSAEEIYQKCAEEMPSISLGTVYRNLHNLTLLKKLKIIKGLDNVDRYDDTLIDHGHILCIKCHKISDIMEEDVLTLKNKVKQKGFILEHFNITVSGICHKCQNRKEEKTWN